MVRLQIYVIVFLVIGEVVLAQYKGTDGGNNTSTSSETTIEKKRKKPSERSTSSSSGDREDKGDEESRSGDSLSLSGSSEETSDEKGDKKKVTPKSSAERRGWRKWHRKCQSCGDEVRKKWKDPSIKWICGHYQNARRSFKSSCMMYYRNCQDGTMFVKLHDNRCANQSGSGDGYHGEHFFYEYKVKLSEESEDSKDSSGSDEDEESYDS